MDFLVQNGINWVVAIQSLGSWLELPMKFFTLLGEADFFFLILPLIYWSVDARLGLRIAVILAVSIYLNTILKLLFAGPRPYWVSAQVKAFLAENTFGIPSGHAQNAAALWGLLDSRVNGRWTWLAAFALTFLIGFSRLYLGVHFVHDVILGWLIGYIILFLFLRYWDPLATWFITKSLAQQMMVAFLISLIMIAVGVWSTARLDGYVFPEEWQDNARRAGALPDPVSIEDTITLAGSMFGFGAGAAWIASRGGYQASGSVEKRSFRYIIGLIGIVILWFGLGEVFPHGETLVLLIFHYIRCALVGFWATAGAPWLFFRFKLAERPKIQDVRLL